MQLGAKVRFFVSALDDRGPPTFSPDTPYRPHLIVASEEATVAGGTADEDYLGVEFTDVESRDGDSIHVSGRTLYPDVDYSSLREGVEFFVVEGIKIVGRGTVTHAGI